MRLIFNALALLLATTALAAPLPSRSNDALTDGASTGEHTLTHHHHLHHMKHAKHAPHHEETEVEARSLFNDDLEERSFYDEEYTQLERRNGEKKKPKLSIVTGAMTKLFKGKNKAPPSSSSKHSIDGSRHVGSPLSANHGNPTPFNAHAGPSNQKFSKAQLNKSLPPTPHSPHRSNSLPSAGHHDAPPPYSRNMHVVNPGSSTSGSVRHPPQRSMTTGSMASLAGTHGSSDRHSIVEKARKQSGTIQLNALAPTGSRAEAANAQKKYEVSVEKMIKGALQQFPDNTATKKEIIDKIKEMFFRGELQQVNEEKLKNSISQTLSSSKSITKIKGTYGLRSRAYVITDPSFAKTMKSRLQYIFSNCTNYHADITTIRRLYWEYFSDTVDSDKVWETSIAKILKQSNEFDTSNCKTKYCLLGPERQD